MARYGIYFDYKGENRWAWTFFAVIIIIVLLLFAISFHTYEYFTGDYSVINIVQYSSAMIHQNIMLTAPTLMYVFLLHNLQKRYAALNQLLK